MSTPVEIKISTFDKLDKYCNAMIRPANLGAVLSRIIEPWYVRMAKIWYENPVTIPRFEKIPETDIQRVDITDLHGKTFKRTLERLNYKLRTPIGEPELITWLADTFIKAFEIEQKNRYKLRFGRLKRI